MGNEELLPCPFEHKVQRGVFVEVDDMDFFFVRVSCGDCGCAGPYVTLDGDRGPTKAERANAIALWNTRALTNSTDTAGGGEDRDGTA